MLYYVAFVFLLCLYGFPPMNNIMYYYWTIPVSLILSLFCLTYISAFACFQKRYRAVYDYAAADEDEVSFLDGDVIVDVQSIDEGWMYGRVERTGQQGMLPANYVEAI